MSVKYPLLEDVLKHEFVLLMRHELFMDVQPCHDVEQYGR